MKKRMLALLLCFAMVFSMIPGQALAQEGDTSTEETQPQVTEPEVTEPETTEPEGTEPEATDPEATEPEETEPEETEPEKTETEATEPEATEETEPEETEPEDEPSAQSDLPGGQCGDSATWTFDESTGLLTISGSGTMYSFISSDPYDMGADIHALPWKSYLAEIRSVKIEQGITSVGSGAFSGASNLTTVSLPEGLEGIEALAFLNAASLTNITLPDGITYLGQSCFSGCTALKVITLPSSLKNLNSSAFSNAGIVEISVPSGIASLQSQVFGTRYLEAIFLPCTLQYIASDAFWGATGLTDIYFEGTEEDWAAIKPSSSNKYNNATVHYNCTGLGKPGDTDDEVFTSVHYFLEWDEANSIATFDTGNVTYLVTEETDAAFSAIPETYLNSFVLVHSKAAPEGSAAEEIILAVERLGSMTGTVSAVDSAGITIDEVVYTPHEGLEDPSRFVGEYVLFHATEYQHLAGLEILKQKEGYLTGWIAETNTMIISPDMRCSTETRMTLSPTDGETLNYISQMSQTPNVAICYWYDSIGHVYKVIPSGFSNSRDGWSFANHWDGFDHAGNYRVDESQYRAVFGNSYVATATASENNIFDSMMPVWSGNCHGMSVAAVLFHDHLLDWNTYIGSQYATANDYSDGVDNDGSGKYYSYAAPASALTGVIERYQIIQWGGDNYWYVNSTWDSIAGEFFETTPDTGNWFSGLFRNKQKYKHNPSGSYIRTVLDFIRNADGPVLIGMRSTLGGHTVVARTDIMPEEMGNGWFKVYIYDPNKPHMPDHLVQQYGNNFSDSYVNSNDQYIELNPEENLWRWYLGSTVASSGASVWGCDQSGTVQYKTIDCTLENGDLEYGASYPDYIYAFSIKNVGLPLSFNGTVPWIVEWKDQVTNLYLCPDTTLRTLDSNGQEILAAINGTPVSNVDGIEYHGYTYTVAGESTASDAGKLTIPYTDFRIEYISGDDFSLVGSDFAFNIASDSPVTLDISMNEGTVTVTSEDGGEILMQLTHIYSNSEYTSVVADGTLEAGDSVTLTLDENTFKGSLTGPGSLELLTDNHNAPDSRPLHNLTEGSGTVEIQDVTANLETVRVELDETLFARLEAVYADGQPCKIIQSETGLYADVPEGTGLLVTYSWHIGDETDVHTQYPTGMKVYRIAADENGYTAEHIPELDDLLQYSGSSIRITGNKGIRMITSLTKGNKSALTGEGLAGFTLEEYGTALCWATDLAPGEDLVLGKDYTRSNYAYKKGVADPIFAQTDTLIQYTNVLVGFNDDQCIPDIAMRPYIILSDAEGNQVTLYGGTVYRSIGYIAWQNRLVFKPGSASYDYVWGIIHHVYGDIYDADYQG